MAVVVIILYFYFELFIPHLAFNIKNSGVVVLLKTAKGTSKEMLIHNQSLFNIENRFCFWSNNNVPFIIQLKLHFSTSNVEVCVFLESRIIDLESIKRNPEEIIAKLNKMKKTFTCS